MKLFRYQTDAEVNWGVETEQGQFTLPALNGAPFTLGTWLAHPDPLGLVADLHQNAVPLTGEWRLLAPLDNQEVWASGVTYERSKVARMEESESGGDFYDKVYAAERPELFFKALPRRVAGIGDEIRIRRDSTWDVPEPEMTLLMAASGQIVGVTVGNDVSSRSIEGENPLYLPQAKSYDGACALGPYIRVVDETVNLRELAITLDIKRDGQVAFHDQTTTARMKRTPEELAGFLFRECTFPDGVFLMTGTGIVPPDSFTLKPGDTVSITIDGVGTLTNTVAPLAPPTTN